MSIVLVAGATGLVTSMARCASRALTPTDSTLTETALVANESYLIRNAASAIKGRRYPQLHSSFEITRLRKDASYRLDDLGDLG